RSLGDFTTDNFDPPYPINGSGIFGSDIDGTNAPDNLTGSIGDDVIGGIAGDDTLGGGSGSDRLVGGSGSDILTGGFGADTFVINAPADGIDTITDLVSAANTAAGDHIEVSAAGFGGGLAAGQPVTLVTAPDVASAINPGSGGYFIFDNDGA